MMTSLEHRSSRPPEATASKPKKSVLIVEDEKDLADLLKYNLEREGYFCRCVPAGDLALQEVTRQPTDLILLDRMLPGLSGDEVAQRLKRDPMTSGIPIILLTAKAEESDQLVGFAIGADDYVTKPFSMKVLLARISAVFRRGQNSGAEADVLSGGPIKLIPSRHEVTVDEQPVSLTPTEFRLLRALMSAQGRVLDRSRLIDKALGPVVAVTDRTIDVHITSLRKKLGVAADWIQTIRGVGYAFRSPSQSESTLE